jgi:hypothetical protein
VVGVVVMPSSEYMREWRTTPAGIAARERDARRDRARTAAVRKLIEMYPTQWQALYAGMLRAYGLDD